MDIHLPAMVDYGGLLAPFRMKSVEYFISFQTELLTEINNIIKGKDYVDAANDDERKDFVGNAVYEYIVRVVGEEHAPKVTGMIIDLPLGELLGVSRSMKSLYLKGIEAYLLMEQDKA